MATWQQHFSKTAEIFPFMLDVASDQLMLIRLTEEEYSAASFLDERLLQGGAEKYVASWSELTALEPAQSRPVDFIFHIGHVGSTLISRLLGEAQGVFALREPLLLRSLADIERTDRFDSYKTHVLNWLSRSFRAEDRAMIKATSFVNQIASELIDDQSRALFLYVPLQDYMETILAGESSRQEVLQMGDSRLDRLNHLLPKPLKIGANNPPCQTIAVSWLCEMASLCEAQRQRAGAKIMWVNFSEFLAQPDAGWSKILAHFELKMTASDCSDLLQGPIMNSYSKAPEHDYSADLRRRLLADARSQYASEIADCYSWINDISGQYPMIEELVNFSQPKG